jgi:hypothetical protein
MCEFTSDGFKQGCAELGVETLDDLIAAIPRMRKELESMFTLISSSRNGQKDLSVHIQLCQS